MQERIQQVIVAGLKDCIAAHGPITNGFAKSAAKRVYGNLSGYTKTHMLESIAIQELRRENKHLRKVIGRKAKNVQDLLDRLEAVGHPLRTGKRSELREEVETPEVKTMLDKREHVK